MCMRRGTQTYAYVCVCMHVRTPRYDTHSWIQMKVKHLYTVHGKCHALLRELHTATANFKVSLTCQRLSPDPRIQYVR